MEYYDGGKLKIEDKVNLKNKAIKKKDKPVLQNGTIVFAEVKVGQAHL